MERSDLISIIFLLAVLLVLVTLWVWHRSKDSAVDLTDLLMENGKLSRLAFTWLGSFMVMSFGFVYAVLLGNLSDIYAALYAATWAVPIVTKMFAIKHPAVEQPTKEIKP